ncbi:MAG: VOC family protein [Planctomycetota bacterium]|jgi:predicted enzyme related to lactoylglutathione lyase
MTEPADGAWCHIEIAAQDVDRAKRFYGECFGWTFQDVPQLQYHLYSTGEGGIGGGLMQASAEFPKHMLNYVNVSDLDAAAGRVENHGGKVLQPKTEVPQTGWFTVVSDPEGNVFGLWQSMAQG